MSEHLAIEDPAPAERAPIQGAQPEAVWRWLDKGWSDFRHAPTIGLAYGLGAVLASYAVCFGLILGGKPALLLPATGGFFILAPLIVSGLYDVSRRLEAGQRVSLWGALFAWRSSAQILLMGGVLLFIHLVWIRVALLLAVLFLGDAGPSLDRLLPLLFGSSRGLALLIVGSIVGGGLALLSFAVSAVALPLIVDRDVSIPEAIARSVATVNRNRHCMALWAALIVVFTGIGIATAFIGLAIVVPVLAHATWHAYRELVPSPDNA